MNQIAEINYLNLGEYSIIMPLEHTKTEQIEQIQAFEELKKEYPILTKNRKYSDDPLEILDNTELADLANNCLKDQYYNDIFKELMQLKDIVRLNTDYLADSNGNAYLVYISNGDIYDETIMYDLQKDEFLMGNVGDFCEEWESEKRSDLITEIESTIESQLKCDNEAEFECGIGKFQIFDKSHELYYTIVEPSIKVYKKAELHKKFHKIPEYTNQIIEMKEPKIEITFEEEAEFYIILTASCGSDISWRSTKKELWESIKQTLYDENNNGYQDYEMW